MVNRIKKICKIFSSLGLKAGGEMALVKTDILAVNIFAPVFIMLAKLLNKSRAVSVDKKNILILLEQRFSVSALNRAYDLSEYLIKAGYKVSVKTPFQSLFSLLTISKFSVIVFQRSVTSKLIDAYFSLSAEKGIKTIYDCDDLVFAPEMANYIKDDINTSEVHWEDIAVNHKIVFDKCNYFLTSTDYLANHARNNNRHVIAFILKNGLNQRYIDICNDLLKTNKPDSDRIIIGYMSGTASHNKDFQLAESSIYAALEKYKNVYLTIIGYLELPERFDKMKERIIRIPKTPFYNLPVAMYKFDINIAPLETGNPFTEGKSELKYVYAGYMGIPTIASATHSYSAAIENNTNGLLCSNDEDWHNSLELLITDKNKRISVGLAAKRHINQNYIPEIMSRNADRIFTEIFQK